MTRQEKEAAILAYCEEVTKGYNDPRPAGLATVESFGRAIGYNYLLIWEDQDGHEEKCFIFYEYPFRGFKDAAIDLLYLLLGLETRALEEEVKRLRGGYLSVRVKAANAFQEIEEQAFGRGHHYKSVDVWDAGEVAKNDEFLGKITDARKKFNAFVDAFIDPPTP